MLFNEIIIAIILSIIVIILQLYFFKKTINDCRALSNLFPDLDSENDSILKVSRNYIDPSSKKYIEVDETNFDNALIVNLISKNKNIEISDKFNEILINTNKYLKFNAETTAEFYILKDIAERISESEENKVSASISLPLYIGLMGTFVGVIFGIINIVFSEDGINTSIITEQSIQAFLSGVFIAMIGSFFGLFLTTINSSYFFKKAKTIRDQRKNKYLNFLQVELLPTLENSLNKSLRMFKDNLVLFNEEFSLNINDFKGTIPNITQNLKQQTELIREFRNVDFAELAKANVKIFDKLNKSTALFENFNNYVTELNNSLLKSSEFIDKLTNLLNRFTEFENNIKDVGKLVKEAGENYGIVGETMMQHLFSLRKRYDLIMELLNKSEDEIKNIAVSFETSIRKISASLEKRIDEIFNFGYTDNPLVKLELLDSINKTLLQLLNKDQRQTNYLDVSQEFKTTIKNLENAVILLRKSIRPSIFRPKEFLQYVFSKNNNFENN